jgi:hypothetical protein
MNVSSFMPHSVCFTQKPMSISKPDQCAAGAGETPQDPLEQDMQPSCSPTRVYPCPSESWKLLSGSTDWVSSEVAVCFEA